MPTLGDRPIRQHEYALQLAQDGDVLASLVAVGDGNEIDGHILFSRLDLLFDDGTSAEAAAWPVR